MNCNNRLENQLDEVSRLERVHGVSNLERVFLDFRPAGGWQNKDCQPSASEVLLVTQVLVGRDEDVVSFFRRGQQIPVAQFCPAHFVSRGN